MGPLSFSQLKVGGGKPVASQDRDTKLFTTTFTLSGFKPMMDGGTIGEEEDYSVVIKLSE